MPAGAVSFEGFEGGPADTYLGHYSGHIGFKHLVSAKRRAAEESIRPICTWGLR